MAKFNMDFTEAKEFVVCGKGEQNLKIINAELNEYQKEGQTRQKIQLTCEVFGGESSGAKVYHSLFLINPTGLYMFLNKIGVSVEKKTYSGLDTKMFIGKTFTATIEHETYTGRDGKSKIRPTIVDSTIRKYVEEQANDLTSDPFTDFGNSVTIDDNFLEDDYLE